MVKIFYANPKIDGVPQTLDRLSRFPLIFSQKNALLAWESKVEKILLSKKYLFWGFLVEMLGKFLVVPRVETSKKRPTNPEWGEDRIFS